MSKNIMVWKIGIELGLISEKLKELGFYNISIKIKRVLKELLKVIDKEEKIKILKELKELRVDMSL